MTRYIDADALDAEMYHKSFEVDDGMNVWNSGLWIRYKIFEEAIRDAPTIDAVPIVRCKDCKRCQNSTVLICGKPKEIFYCDGARKMLVESYDYCSWAERKEE